MSMKVGIKIHTHFYSQYFVVHIVSIDITFMMLRQAMLNVLSSVSINCFRCRACNMTHPVVVNLAWTFTELSHLKIKHRFPLALNFVISLLINLHSDGCMMSTSFDKEMWLSIIEKNHHHHYHNHYHHHYHTGQPWPCRQATPTMTGFSLAGLIRNCRLQNNCHEARKLVLREENIWNIYNAGRKYMKYI